jgi:NitT/TauT family transport system permease protein
MTTTRQERGRRPAARTFQARSGRPAGKRRAAARLVAPAGFFLLVLAAWLFVSYVLLAPERRFLLPPPQDVVHIGFLTWANLSEILQGLWQTTQVALTGLAVAMAVGTLSAIAMVQATWVEWSVYPWAVVLQTIPILAIVPLIGFWFQYGFASRVLVCVLISLFPIITNTLFGLKSAEPAQHDLFTLHRASRWQRLVKLQLPGGLPAMVSGWRIAAGLSVVGAIVGDFFFQQGQPGIGRLINDYSQQLQSEQLFAAIILSSLLGLVVFWVFGFIGRLLVGSWHQAHGPDE